MKLPRFNPGDDPGPDFAELARRSSPTEGSGWPVTPSAALNDVVHGTTVLTVRFADGVVIAGDRRATAGNFISHRRIEKVYPADRHSGVAIAGAAGPAIEMVRLFQLQLEHYEKVEGTVLSLEGKANQLGQMVRNHLPAAMAGLAVVPLFAGYDLRRQEGRLFQYDVTGGRYEELDHATSGSGSLHAGTVLKLGYTPAMARDATIDLALRAIYTAADEDTATGGADVARGIYPVVATITADGFARVEDDELARRSDEVVTDLFGARPTPRRGRRGGESS